MRFLASSALVAILSASAVGAASPDSVSSKRFDFGSVSRLAVVWDSQALFYGVWPDIVSVGEELADFLASRGYAFDPSRGEPTAPDYTLFLGNSESVLEFRVGRDWIANDYGVAALPAADLAKIKYFVSVRPVGDRIESASADSLREFSLQYVGQAELISFRHPRDDVAH